jgi:glucose-1-phosphate cytidylyltransferase
MVEIGGRPILWHIMKIYSCYGINDFVICCGYKGYMIKEYFANYWLHVSDVTFDLRSGSTDMVRNGVEPWRVTLVDTGDATMTGGRMKRVREQIGSETFCMTYGDGVADVDIGALIAFHREQGRLATLTAVHPPGRFGAFSMDAGESLVRHFAEKPTERGEGGAWVNGGFFVVEPQALDYIEGDATVWERQPMEQLARSGQLAAYRHMGFWQPMDTLRDKMVLEAIWNDGKPPWRVWTG